MRAERLYALLGELPDETVEEQAVWDRAYHKFLLLAALADGESELAALAYADQHLAWWQFDRLADSTAQTRNW